VAAAPESMRQAMVDYVHAVHEAYSSQARLQPPGIRGRMPLLGRPFTVAAAGAHNLHVIATRDPLGTPQGPEIEIADQTGDLAWTVRFFDPVVVPVLGMIDEENGPALGPVRRALGLSGYLYHLVVQPGATLGAHHAGHAGAGLANDHLAAVREYESIRAVARGREGLVDELEGAEYAGLPRAHALLAKEVAPWDNQLVVLTATAVPDTPAIRRRLLTALRRTDAG